MMAGADIVASLPDIGETQIHHYAQRRCYTPLPSLHVRPSYPFPIPFTLNI